MSCVFGVFAGPCCPPWELMDTAYKIKPILSFVFYEQVRTEQQIYAGRYAQKKHKPVYRFRKRGVKPNIRNVI